MSLGAIFALQRIPSLGIALAITGSAALAGCASSAVRRDPAAQEPATVAAAVTPATTEVPAIVLADSLARARRYTEAAAAYARAMAAHPDSTSWAKRAVGSFWRAARYEEAYRWGQKVVAAAPTDREALFNLGVTCGFLLALDCLEASFTRAVALDSAYVLGHGELGFLAQARGDLQAAVVHMERAYRVAPADDFAVSGLAQVLIPAGDPARALAIMEPRLNANRQARAYGGRSMLTLHGWALLELGDTVRARAAFDEVLGWLAERERSGQTSYQLHRERAAIFALLGERDAALAAMERAFDQGWRLYGAATLTDPMFRTMRHLPAVQALVARMRADVEAQRRRLGFPNTTGQ